MIALSLALAITAQEPILTPIQLDAPVYGLDLFDVNGDGQRDLLVGRDDRLEFLDWTGDDSSTVLATFDRSDSGLFAWWCTDVGDVRTLFLLRDGGDVLRWRPGAEAPEVVYTDRRISLPSGVYPFEFVRNLRGQGAPDFALLHSDGIQVVFAEGDEYVTGPKVRHEFEANWSGSSPKSLPLDIEQSLSVPSFTAEDQNGDGHYDLVFETGDRVQFFWSGSDGSLPTEPTFELDLEALRAKLPTLSTASINPSNLLELLESRVDHSIRDLDADGHADLLLQQGPRVVVYGGTRNGIDRSKARQVLKSSGNLLAAFATDENQDGRLDLCMLRVADVSLGQVLLWVVVGGTLKFDLFAYHQDDEAMRFSRRPSSHRTLAVTFGPILSIEDDLEDPIDSLKGQFVTVPVPGDFDGDGEVDDLFVPRDDRRLELFTDVSLPKESRYEDSAWKSVLSRFDSASDSDDNLEIPLERILDWAPYDGRDRLDLIRGRTPTLQLTAPRPNGWEDGDHSIYRVTLTQGGRDAIVHLDQDGFRKPVLVTLVQLVD